MTWFAPERLFDGAALHAGLGVRIEGGRVVEVGLPPPGAHPVEGTLTPGFVDLQVNGGGGVLLNTDPTPEGLRAIAAAHRRFGTVAILPTLITDAPEVMARATDAALAVAGETGLLGLHLEGPHIAPARKGTHDPRFMRPLDDTTEASVARLRAAGVSVMVTLAAEVVPPDAIARLAATGAVVSIGHSDATAEQAHAAFEAGARAATHLYNAMSPLHHRAPGLVGAILGGAGVSGIIADGIHVADDALRTALAACGPDRLFLVSDAMPTVGGPESFTLYGQTLTVRDGALVNAAGSLAGAHTTMAEGVAKVVALGAPLERALRMAVTIPARLIGRPDLAALSGRPLDDLIVLGGDGGVAMDRLPPIG